MYNNNFSFADNFWVQLFGTTMGTLSACAYAKLFFQYHENTLISLHSKDDIFGTLMTDKSNTNNLNIWDCLEWVIEEPSTKTVSTHTLQTVSRAD
jgi:hypothetical protein